MFAIQNTRGGAGSALAFVLNGTKKERRKREMSKEKQPKKNLSEYQKFMNQKFDIEDRQAKIFNERWKLKNENAQCSKQLRLVEDQIRLMFDRIRIEKEEEESN